MQIDHLDHLVLTVQDIERTCEFYARALGMQVSLLLGPVERTGASKSPMLSEILRVCTYVRSRSSL